MEIDNNMEDKLVKTGFLCLNCKQLTSEEWLRNDGTYYYRCQNCIDNADQNDPNPCPNCGCKAHLQIANRVPHTIHGSIKLDSDISNPFRPDIESLDCLNCGHGWNTPEFEEYVVKRAIMEIKVKHESGKQN